MGGRFLACSFLVANTVLNTAHVFSPCLQDFEAQSRRVRGILVRVCVFKLSYSQRHYRSERYSLFCFCFVSSPWKQSAFTASAISLCVCTREPTQQVFPHTVTSWCPVLGYNFRGSLARSPKGKILQTTGIWPLHWWPVQRVLKHLLACASVFLR